MIKIKQYNGDEIDILSLLDNQEQNEFLSFYNHKNSWASAVVDFLGQRQQKIGDFIGDNNDVFIDCGAHIGLFSMIFQKTAQKIYAIEPFIKNYKFLCQFTKNFPNIKPVNCAIGIETKEVPLFIDNVNETQTSLIVHPCSREYINVKSVTLLDFCAQNNIDKIDFLKLDIEGAELPLVINENFNDISKKISKIHCEVHNIEDGEHNIGWEQVRNAVSNKLRNLNFNIEIHNDEIFAKK